MKQLHSFRWLVIGMLLLLFVVRLQAGIGPFINIPPASQTNYTGASASFTVAAGGTTPLFYFWQKNNQPLADGGNISGSVSAALTVTNLAPTDSGNYSVVVSNAFGTVSTGAGLTVYTRLVQNGGFESGDISGWTASDEILLGLDAIISSSAAHSGSWGFEVGVPDAPGYLSQVIPTSAGQPYLISVWVNSDGQTPNEFIVSWDGTNRYDSLNLPAQGWVNFQLTASASSTNCVLSIGAQSAGFFSVDDVSIIPIPAFQNIANQGTNVLVTWIALAGFPYQIQYQTNLSSKNWINYPGGFYFPTNTTTTMTDSFATDRQRFYRLLVQP
jgi:Immunoglobulin I-set domain